MTQLRQRKEKVRTGNNCFILMMLMMANLSIDGDDNDVKGEEEKRSEETLAAFRSYLPALLARFALLLLSSLTISPLFSPSSLMIIFVKFSSSQFQFCSANAPNPPFHLVSRFLGNSFEPSTEAIFRFCFILSR